MAASNFSDIDEYGFRRADDFDYGSYGSIMSVYYPVLANRRQKWEILMKNTDLSKKTNKLKRYIRKGIPGPFRSEVWMKTSGAYLSQKKQPQLYKKLLKTQYEADIVETIKIDLPRTFPENIRFPEIERKLFNVLVAYAHYNKDIGYCQGLNYIAGLILIVTKNEETTFWLLREMVENIVPNYHTKTMSGLIVDIDVLSELVRIKVPYCYDHIKNMGLPWAVIATKWFICLYAEVLPIETVLRIWDCLFMEGSKILFRVGLTLVMRQQSEILKCDDMSSVADLFREMDKIPLSTDCHNFIASIFKVPGTLKRRQIEKVREGVVDKIKK